MSSQFRVLWLSVHIYTGIGELDSLLHLIYFFFKASSYFVLPVQCASV